MGIISNEIKALVSRQARMKLILTTMRETPYYSWDIHVLQSHICWLSQGQISIALFDPKIMEAAEVVFALEDGVVSAGHGGENHG